MKKHLIYISMLIAVLLTNCEDIYEPDIEEYPNALVVECILTDQNEYTQVKLTRSAGFKEHSYFANEKGAVVSIESESGEKWETTMLRAGYYETNEPVATREGEGYFVKIITADGEEYRSEVEVMVPYCPIDSIYLTDTLMKDVMLSYWGEPVVKYYGGITFSVKPIVKPEANVGFLYKWNALVNQYIYTADPPTEFHYYCWEELYSNKIYVYDYGQEDHINELPMGDLHFLSDYAMSPLPIDSSLYEGTVFMEYSTGLYYHLRQFSITEKGARFWRSVKKQTEASGKLFDPVEEQIIGNIYCVSDSSKVAFGYFNTASFSDKVVKVTLVTEPFSAVQSIDVMPVPPDQDFKCGVGENYFNVKPDFWF
ncbi:MAG: DUF4249 domain-containing protein [Prolixibacteraceae bacterium]|nr:DUF4249 domain-containing protein [Prolixibacteraceae bacterium]